MQGSRNPMGYSNGNKPGGNTNSTRLWVLSIYVENTYNVIYDHSHCCITNILKLLELSSILVNCDENNRHIPEIGVAFIISLNR